MCVSYNEIQVNTIEATIKKEEIAIENKYDSRKQSIINSGKATVKEGVKIVAVSAASEAVIDGGISLIEHIQEKGIKGLDRDDAKEIGVEALKGAGKGAIRGGAVYAITNMTSISVPVAGAIVSSGFATVESTASYINGEISGKQLAEELIEKNADIAVCTLFARIGAKVLKKPTVGTLIGGAVGMIVIYSVKKLVKELYTTEKEAA